MRIVAEALNKFQQAIMIVAIIHDLLVESLHLLSRWQLAINYEERSLQEI
jgi:two-component sensor histidine kinase